MSVGYGSEMPIFPNYPIMVQSKRFFSIYFVFLLLLYAFRLIK